MKQKGRINTNQAKALLSRISKVNLDNQAKVDEFINYVANVFNNAEYDQYIAALNKRLPRAKNAVEKKIGTANALTIELRKLFSINPSKIPVSSLYQYGSLVDTFSKNSAILPIGDINTVTQMVTDILADVDAELSTIPGLTTKFYNTTSTVMNAQGSVDYAATLDAMLKNNEITENERDLMKKYKSEILPSPSTVKPTQQQTQQEKDDAIDEIINNVSITTVGLSSDLEKGLALSISRLIKNREILKRLSINELNNIIALADNINNGILPAIANTINNRLVNINNAIPVSKSVDNAKLTTKSKMLKNFMSTPKAIMESFKNNPLRLIDEMFGDFKTQTLYNGIFDRLAKMFNSYESRLGKINNKLDSALDGVVKSFKRSPNKIIESKMKMALYRIQREYEANPGDPRAKPALAYLDSILEAIPDGDIMYNERDGEILRGIREKYGVRDSNGKVVGLDLNSLEASFNQAENNALKVFDEINLSIEPEAVFTADVIRNNKIRLLNKYNHIVRVSSKGNPVDYVQEALDSFNQNNISTESGALQDRGTTVGPINLDIFSTVQSGAKSVLLDYYMTDAVRQARGTLKESMNISKEDGPLSADTSGIYSALDTAVEQVLKNVLSNSYAMDGMSDATLKFLQRMGYKSMLASVPRAASELTSNMAYVVAAGWSDFTEGVKYRGVIMNPSAGDVMINLNSSMTTRVLGKEGLTGRALDSNVTKRAIGTSRSRANSAVVDKAMQIYNYTLNPVRGGIDALATNLITVSDKLMLRPLWFGAFAKEFKKITGTEVDFEKIANNDQSYMRQYQTQLEEATKYADNKTAMAGSTSNPFMSSLGRQINATDSSLKKFWKTFDNFMNQFVINEFFVARRAIHDVFLQGTLSRKEAGWLLAGVVLRSSIYFTMSKVVGNAFFGMLLSGLGLKEVDDEDDDDEKTMAQAFGQGFASAATTLILGQNLGNISRSFVNYGVEKVNENYFDFLRSGEYNAYEDAIQYNIVPPSGKTPQFKDILIGLSGPYAPTLRTSEFAYKKFTEAPKKEEDAIKRQDREMYYRLPIEVLGSTGFVPLYKDVRTLTNKWIYQELDKERAEQNNKDESEKETPYGMNMSDLKRYHPDVYEEYYGKGTEAEAQRKLKKEKADAERAIKDALYGYEPSVSRRKDRESVGFGSSKFGSKGKSKRGGFGSSRFGSRRKE
jgi:hypothetical protein